MSPTECSNGGYARTIWGSGHCAHSGARPYHQGQTEKPLDPLLVTPVGDGFTSLTATTGWRRIG